MNQLKMLLPALAAAMGVVGCFTEVVEPGKGPAADAVPLDGQLAYRYGVWIEKNLRIVSDTGEPLPDALVTGPPTSRRYPVGKDGTVSLKCYGACSVRLSVSAPGHYGCVVNVMPGKDEVITLRRKKNPHPMQELNLRLRLPKAAPDDSWRVDLVAGDWLPPHGFGRVADAVFCMVDESDADNRSGGSTPNEPVAKRRISSASLSGAQKSAWYMRFLQEGDGFAFAGDSFPDELRTPYEVDCGACTNSSLRCGPYSSRGSNVVFRVRGHCGVLLGVPSIYSFVYHADKHKEAGEYAEIFLSGRVNKAPGEPGIEPEDCPGVTSVPPPVQRALPDGTNLFAFGVSPDGRGAVFFGKTTPSVRVPDMFPRAVYTAEPASELAAVETLYVDTSSGSASIPARAFAGLPNLRSVVVIPTILRIEEEAFAGCPKLNAVLFPGMDARNPSPYWCPVVAENAFAECAKDVSAIFFKLLYSGDAGGVGAIACTNVWSRQICVPLSSDTRNAISDARSFFAPKVDFEAGKVEIPLVRFDGSRIERESQDGRIFVLGTDGALERRVK